MDIFRKDVLDKNHCFIHLNRIPASSNWLDVAVIIINHSRPDLTDSMVQQLKNVDNQLKIKIFVVNVGPEKYRSKNIEYFDFEDKNNNGECFSYNLGLRLALYKGNSRYHWMVSNRITLENGLDSMVNLVHLADSNPKIAVLYDSEKPKIAGGKNHSLTDFYLATSSPYSAFLVRTKTIKEVGFLNPDFKYNIGAMEELSFHLYSKGWEMACRNKIENVHDINQDIWQEEELHKAKEFAARYFVEHYGKNWDEEFAKVLPVEIESNTYTLQRRAWENVLGENERNSYITKMNPDLNLKQQIEALNPWYYEVTIGNFKVVPGVGSKQSKEELRERVSYRSRILEDEVVKRYDFSKKRLLDIACNCGYWASHYAQRGACSLLGIEGRLDYIKQAWLYWDNNEFMKKDSYEFLKGNVMDVGVWDRIKEKGPYDFTLCAGILYHIPEYETLLKYISSVTTEAILVDTRVSQEDLYIEEPGGWCFDAIIETRAKRVPNLDQLTDLLNNLGFNTEKISTDSPTPVGLKDADDYSIGNRVTLLATKY